MSDRDKAIKQSSGGKYKKNTHTKVILQVLVHNKSYFKQRSKQENIASACTRYTGLASASYSRQPPGDWCHKRDIHSNIATRGIYTQILPFSREMLAGVTELF